MHAPVQISQMEPRTLTISPARVSHTSNTFANNACEARCRLWLGSQSQTNIPNAQELNMLSNQSILLCLGDWSLICHTLCCLSLIPVDGPQVPVKLTCNRLEPLPMLTIPILPPKLYCPRTPITTLPMPMPMPQPWVIDVLHLA